MYTQPNVEAILGLLTLRGELNDLVKRGNRFFDGLGSLGGKIERQNMVELGLLVAQTAAFKTSISKTFSHAKESQGEADLGTVDAQTIFV